MFSGTTCLLKVFCQALHRRKHATSSIWSAAVFLQYIYCIFYYYTPAH